MPQFLGPLAPPLSPSICALLGLLAFSLLPSALCAPGGFTNSATLGAAVNGTNLVVTYSLTTTQGWVTLLVADGVAAFASKTQQAGPFPVPPSRQGQFLVPLNPVASTKFFTLLVEEFPASLMNFPDLSVVMPADAISIDGTGANRMFRYTHLTFNGGAGPLEILPIYNPAAGVYLGYQRVYSFEAGIWTLRRTTPVAGAFVFHAAHGHFHFPFAAFGLYFRNANGGIGNPAVLSEKNGFCIGDSYLYDNTLTNAGAFFGDWGSCTDPTSLRGLSIGAVDEYNQLDPGQSIPIAGLSDGRYWLRAMADPDNLLAESNESNNETDVDLTIVGNSVTVNQIVTPVLAPPPGIVVTSPGAGNVADTVQLKASTSVIGAGFVQFLIDGLAFGGLVAGPPYTLPWDTTVLQNGTHWLAAQTTDLTTQRVGTSEVTFVNINNGDTNPPMVQLTGPAPNSTVSAVVTVSANVSAQAGVPSVQFYVDNVPLGSPVTAPPYMTTWNSLTGPGGVHVITAVATDQGGLVGNSAPVSVTVDNSHPADPLGRDVLVFQDASDTMETPAFSTTTASDLLVAFVAYDGPAGPQTATVSGAGLPWQLVMRSNAQRGTSEIWTAKATNALSSATVIAQPGSAGYHGSLTVIAFTNASGPGIPARTSAPTGAPDIYVPGVSAGNWVFAVGNDWDGAVARTPVSGQVLVHERVDTQAGDTFWVQSTAAPSPADGNLVTIHDNAPTNHQWNYAAVEIVATRQ